MKAFLELGFEDGAASPVGIEWKDPADIAEDAEEIDQPETIDAAGIRAIPKDALKTILNFILVPPVAGQSARKKWRVSLLRLAVLSHAAGVDNVGNLSLTQLAAELECSRALTSLYAIRLTDQLQQAQVRGGKSRAARETFRQAAIASHAERGHRMRHLPETPHED